MEFMHALDEVGSDGRSGSPGSAEQPLKLELLRRPSGPQLAFSANAPGCATKLPDKPFDDGLQQTLKEVSTCIEQIRSTSFLTR